MNHGFFNTSAADGLSSGFDLSNSFNKSLHSCDIVSKGDFSKSNFSFNILLFFSSSFFPMKGGLADKRNYIITPHDQISLFSEYLFLYPIASGGR